MKRRADECMRRKERNGMKEKNICALRGEEEIIGVVDEWMNG